MHTLLRERTRQKRLGTLQPPQQRIAMNVPLLGGFSGVATFGEKQAKRLAQRLVCCGQITQGVRDELPLTITAVGACSSSCGNTHPDVCRNRTCYAMQATICLLRNAHCITYSGPLRCHALHRESGRPAQ